MMYLWPTSSSLKDTGSQFGVLTTPSRWGVPTGMCEGRLWACDNEAFTDRFLPARWLAYLNRLQPYCSTCLFVSIPDIVGNACATLNRWRTHFWWAQVRELGYPVAFVAQDGQEWYQFPPADQWDWLFIGGTTTWKMGVYADDCIHRAQELGKRVHVGRINSVRRLRHFQKIGVDTCDGTGPCFAPNNYKRLLGEAFQQSVMPLYAVSDSDSVG